MTSSTATPDTIDAYIAGFPPEVQVVLQQVRATIRAAAPDAIEAITHRIPTFVYGGNLVHFAAFSRHVGLYPAPSGTEHFKVQLAPYKAGKGSVQFPLGRPMPVALIGQIVAFRVQELRDATEAKARAKQLVKKRR
jgi:uncharacterized protein YdhG (YjbR/CyaY superfamily)